EALSQVDRAVALYHQVLARNPRLEEAFDSLVAIFEREHRDEQLGQLLKERLKRALEPAEIARLYLRLGRLHRRLAQPEETARCFEEVLAREPTNQEAMEQLREWYEELSDKEKLAGVLQRLLDLETHPARVRAHWLRLAELWGDLGQGERAVEAARRAMALAP